VNEIKTAPRSVGEHPQRELLVEVRGLSKTFKGGKQVLRGVDLNIPRGTILGLLGKNGSGKTTLLKCMLGLLHISGGSANILGDNAWDLSPGAKSQLGYVPQVVSLYPWMKIKHILAYTAAFYSHWNHNLMADLVRRWELNLDDRIGTLSVGQLQKLAIVLALGHEPELLVLDEPAASLDPVARREFLTEVLSIADQADRTVVFSTHITSDIERVADTVAILKDGRVLFHGELGELKDSIKRLHITSDRLLPTAFAVPGALSVQVDGQRAVVAVRNWTPELIAELREQWRAEVEVEDLNLEDIFLELHQAAQ
jgi:ABC-2 type transport system ATP-binding protein